MITTKPNAVFALRQSWTDIIEFRKNKPQRIAGFPLLSFEPCQQCIPIAFQDATLLPAFAHPDHLLLVGSQGFAHLSPSSILNSLGYM
ncbi:hypothetical protein GZ78_17010 [Endozoicomonas numazuensis]|uniref:Uncharacterized protein n=1 Tax=Endozoicomonas numazuensis TaxID=1137799 RepID=A0A081NG98_9GAMM|nr:hypothetical protein GZ78_17010 [Endozoicomonas numazuensis]